MKKHTAIRRLLALLLFAVLGLCLGGLSQAVSPAEYDGILNIEPYKNKIERPIAAFSHEAHWDLADDCTACHHGKTADGKKTIEEYDPEASCDSCHSVDGGKGVTPLKRAYHQQCIGCHTTVAKGPVHCAGCHQS